MRVLELLRSKAFWLMDSRGGGKVRQYLDLLDSVEGKDGWDVQKIKEYQQARINELLEHCVRTVPAYKNMNTELLDTWPVVNKMILKDGGADYLSSAYDNADLIPMTTSGSTGTPFTCWQNKDKKRHVNAEVLYYNGLIGYAIGRKIIYFRSVVREVSKSRLQQFLQNINLIDCNNLGDDDIRQKLSQIKKLSKKGGAMILSYASTLDVFSKYFERYGMEEAQDCNIYGIVSGSEMLKDSTRNTISKAFRCKVVSRYANEENGFIGQDGFYDNVFLHNRADYYVEILKFDSDMPATPGEVGRIVVTDLYNYAMPMVRYDTGDVGAWQEISINGVSRRAIGKFGGRRVDVIYDSSGNIISPHAITNYMWQYENMVRQFQFVQDDKTHYILKINVVGDCNYEKIVNDLLEIVGSEDTINIEKCDDIPVLASGKRRYIVNRMNSNAK